MKACPCCMSLTFDDMQRCYVCGNPFPPRSDDATPEAPRANNAQAAKAPRAPTAAGASPQSLAWNPSETVGEAPPRTDLSSLGEVCVYPSDALFVAEAPGTSRMPRWNVRVEPRGFPAFDVTLHDEGDVARIGRSADNDIVIFDLHVSRHHASLMICEGELWVRDLGSKNYTLLDGIPLVGSCKLVDGARLVIGTATLHVRCVADG